MSPGTDLGLGPGSQGAAYADWIDGDLVQTWSAWYRDATAPDEPLVSPLFGDFHGVAPIYVQAGGADSCTKASCGSLGMCRRRAGT